jgi:hypothetical protein
MTDSMVDRVARAILLKSFTAGQSGALCSAPLSDAACNELAIAALDALREPSGHMAYAGIGALEESQTPGTKISTVSWGTHIRIYQAMIDAARS